MSIFEDIQSVEEWLEPLEYIDFWEAIEPYRVLATDDRDHCDDLIAKGAVRQNLILECLKGLARMELSKRFNLADRIPEPVDAQYVHSVH